MKIEYVPKRFQLKSLDLIAKADEIIENYANAGYDLTLRQLYYQMVAHNFISNSQKSYKNFGKLISDARLAGRIDWERIVDRTRQTKSLPHWEHPSDVIYSAYYSYNIDHWEGQDYRPRVWIEKDALIGVISRTCNEFDVPFLACKGYMSQSAMWRDSQTMGREIMDGLRPTIIYLGDHDPSGIHISKEDIPSRMNVFGSHVEIRRIALNMDQVEEKSPPPNWAKLSDTRSSDYIKEFGDKSWELDALEPDYINRLLTSELTKLIDQEQWDNIQARLTHHKTMLKAMTDHYGEIETFLEYEGII